MMFPLRTRAESDLAIPLVAVLLSLLAGLTAVSPESLWIDEANSALKAMQPSLATWWQVMATEHGSDLQMPFYMLQLWVWEKLFGHREFALRAVNIVWFCLGQFALARVTARAYPRVAWTVVLFGTISPILWFYLNDARPYLMQYGAAGVLCAVLFRATVDPLSASRPAALWTFGAGLLLLCGSSLLGVIWAAGALGAWLYLTGGRLRMNGPFRDYLPILVSFGALALLGLYYLWTILLGAGASTIGDTGIRNVAFIGYEILGVTGLGPGRLEIREFGFSAFRDLGGYLFLLVSAAALSLGLFIYGMQAAARHLPRRASIAALIFALPPTFLLLAVGYTEHFRLLGRHFMPVFPVVLGLFAFAIWRLRFSHRGLAALALVALVGVWLTSSLSLRFSDRHRKDDYRSAARIAKEALARNESVWWSADWAAATYYEVPVTAPAQNGSVVLVVNRSRADLARLTMPDLVIASKPDIYDSRTDALGSYLLAHRFARGRELPAFTIWRKAADPSAVR